MKYTENSQDMKDLINKLLADTSKNVENIRSDFEKSVLNHIFIPLEGVEETEDSIIVRAVLPGVKKEDLNIQVTESKLEFDATFDLKLFKGINIIFSNEKNGKINRIIKLPEKVIPENSKAKLENGILNVEIPKQEKEEKCKVNID